MTQEYVLDEKEKEEVFEKLFKINAELIKTRVHLEEIEQALYELLGEHFTIEEG